VYNEAKPPSSNQQFVGSKPRIGGLVVKLAVAIHHRTVSASPGFDSRPMQLVEFLFFGSWILWTIVVKVGWKRKKNFGILIRAHCATPNSFFACCATCTATCPPRVFETRHLFSATRPLRGDVCLAHNALAHRIRSSSPRS
jgi:hypothetical protein